MLVARPTTLSGVEVLDDEVVLRSGVTRTEVEHELAGEAANPISDQRGTASFRRHAVGVVATRALQRSLAA